MTSTITGMMKVFKQNYLTTNSVTYSVTSGSGTIENIKDFDRDTKWESSGSDDTTTETIDITFANSVSINRILLLNMNFKEFTIQWFNGVNYVDFDYIYTEQTIAGGVYGTDEYGYSKYGVGSSTPLSAINETDNNEVSRYYEFDSVSLTKLRITVTKTIVPNAQKFLYELYIGLEMGTFIEDLTSEPNSYLPIVNFTNSMYLQKSNNGEVAIRRGAKYRARVTLTELMEVDDQELVESMYDDGQFAIWPCGGVGHRKRGWRHQDLYHVIIRGNEEAEYAIGRVEYMGLNHAFDLREQ